MKNDLDEKICGQEKIFKLLDLLFVPSSLIRIQKNISKDSIFKEHKWIIYCWSGAVELERLYLYYQGLVKLLDYF